MAFKPTFTFPHSEEDFVTVICLRVEPRYEEVVMSRAEFERFNKVFKPREEEGYFAADLLEEFKFKDWNTINLDSPLDSFKYYFRAYSGDVTSGSDDVIFMDSNLSWQKPFKRKCLTLRGDEGIINT